MMPCYCCMRIVLCVHKGFSSSRLCIVVRSDQVVKSVCEAVVLRWRDVWRVVLSIQCWSVETEVVRGERECAWKASVCGQSESWRRPEGAAMDAQIKELAGLKNPLTSSCSTAMNVKTLVATLEIIGCGSRCPGRTFDKSRCRPVPTGAHDCC